MKYRTRIYYSEADKALMWDRWQGDGRSSALLAGHRHPGLLLLYDLGGKVIHQGLISPSTVIIVDFEIINDLTEFPALDVSCTGEALIVDYLRALASNGNFQVKESRSTEFIRSG